MLVYGEHAVVLGLGHPGVAARAEMLDMGRVGHYMLRRQGRWNAVATTRTLDVLR